MRYRPPKGERRITQADYHAAGRGFARDIAEGLALLRDRDARRKQLRGLGFAIPDEGSLAALAKLRDNGGSD